MGRKRVNTSAKTSRNLAEEIGDRHRTIRTEMLLLDPVQYSSFIGVSVASVYAWESGRRNIPHSVLNRLEKEKGISSGWILTGEGVPEVAVSSARQSDSPFAKQLSALNAHLAKAGKLVSDLSRFQVPLQKKLETRFPLMSGSVSAGKPHETIDDIDTLDIVEFLVKNPLSTFFVTARGESMRDAGISDGDLLIVDTTAIPISGQVVVAEVFGDKTVKRFIRNGTRVLLKAENPAFDDIDVSDNMDFRIVGVVSNCIKKM